VVGQSVSRVTSVHGDERVGHMLTEEAAEDPEVVGLGVGNHGVEVLSEGDAAGLAKAIGGTGRRYMVKEVGDVVGRGASGRTCDRCHMGEESRAHRKKHKETCKQCAAKLKDEQLYYGKGLERPEGDFCPICTQPIPLPMQDHSMFQLCCIKGFAPAALWLPGKEACLTLTMIRARVKKKDPEAMTFLGAKYFLGELGLQKDIRKAVELYTEAAKLGLIDALFNLGYACFRGEDVEKDKTKGVEFFKRAALQGHVESRHCLGLYEGGKGNYDRAYAAALKGYHDAVEEMKIQDRDDANNYFASILEERNGRSELLEQVFVRGGGRVRVTVKSPSPVLLPSDGGKRDAGLSYLLASGALASFAGKIGPRYLAQYFTGIVSLERLYARRPGAN
ncbi:hypothetical protein THAOC_13002, partial [Thalassiosira oceanica]